MKPETIILVGRCEEYSDASATLLNNEGLNPK